MTMFLTAFRRQQRKYERSVFRLLCAKSHSELGVSFGISYAEHFFIQNIFLKKYKGVE